MKTTFALEINEQWLKLIKIRPSNLQLPAIECISESISSLMDEQITEIIIKASRELKIKSKPLFVSLPRNLAMVRNLHLPSRDDKEISQMIDLHIKRIVPYSKEEIILSHKFIGYDEMGYAKIILAIVQRDIIRRQWKIFEAAGLSIEEITLSSYGAWKWVLRECKSEITKNDLYLLLDIDSHFTDFIIFSKNELLFTRSITLQSKDLLKQSGITKIIGEVKQSLVIFQNEETNKKPVKIFLSGCANNIKGLDEFIKKELEMPLKIIDGPLLKNKNVPKEMSITAVAELASEKSTKGISFVIPELQIKKSLKEKTRELTILGSLIIYFLSAIYGIFLIRIYNQRDYLNKLNNRCNLIEQEIGYLINQSEKIGLLKNYLDLRKTPLVFLYKLQNLIPAEIAIDYLSLDEAKKVILKGQASQLSNVFNFVTTLEKSKYFQDIQTKYTRKKKRNKQEVAEFEIGFSII